MKIAILCPVGPLDRYGYQYIHMPVVESFSAFATCVYLYSTTRNRANVNAVLARFSNVRYISNEATWYNLDSSGTEVFTLDKIRSNNDLLVQQARQDGMDCSITISINMYIPERARDPLRKACQDMLKVGQPYGWIYRRYQLGDRLFHADSRLPNMFNLHTEHPCHLGSDWTDAGDDSKRVMIESGEFRLKNHMAIVDCPLEMTIRDLEEKMNFVQCYSHLRPGVSSHFNWNEYYPYFIRKFSDKIISSDPLGKTGQEITQISRSDFVSQIILQKYRKPILIRRWYRFLHGSLMTKRK